MSNLSENFVFYRAYTGVGSRNTPEPILRAMTRAAVILAKAGYTLRSGHAVGADRAFERGAGTRAEIYTPIPVAGFRSPLGKTLDYCLLAASVVHPAWDRCSTYARLLHARNVCQVFGMELHNNSEFLVCWAPPHPNGLDVRGGTNTAWRLAGQAGIPRYNLAVPQEQSAFLYEILQPANNSYALTPNTLDTI